MINYKTINDNKSLVIEISGDFIIDDSDNIKLKDTINKIESLPELAQIDFDATALNNWDSSILTFLNHIKSYCLDKNILFIKDSLPVELKGLLLLLRLCLNERE